MASLLRQIVAGPRARHPEAGLDLCYVTDNIIATSGPSGTYPQRAYRNPLDSLVKWLDDKHGEDWAIWEFRAEGTGYPDSEVYNRVYHYPFPDHHPPPFALIPNIMASMRNWLHEKEGRVVVVHCKAGKGRSGTASCSYLIAEEGWSVHKALQRFTERRMRPNMGKGVSIPSQLRWISYVERWAKHKKIYLERKVEILEVHCWGLRDGVKIQVEGFVEDGKVIKSFHTFTRSEREIVRGEIEKGGGLASVVAEVMDKNGIGRALSKKGRKQTPLELESNGTTDVNSAAANPKSSTSSSLADQTDKELEVEEPSLTKEDLGKDGKGDVVFRPSTRVVLPTSDINIDVERRNKAAFDLTYVTAVAHVWFNAYFEGNGPEQDGQPDDSGVFEITWDAMDGIKGSSRKGIPAFDKIAILWKALPDESGKPGIVISEPKEGEEVKQSTPADWQGEDNVAPSEGKDLGLRTSSPVDSTADISKASSVKSGKSAHAILTAPSPQEGSAACVRSHGPNGEDTIEDPGDASGSGPDEQTQSPTPPRLATEQVDGTAQTKASAGPSMQPVKSHESDSSGIQTGAVSQYSTDSLPDGKPESELKNAKEHVLFHIGHKKKHMSS
ncbi:hypothetical protein BU24DRAFT_162685 [Aaosphaeria arxii CBS 175.79]|uniref:phosphatidylinositol-3,4,5-trisphosphate 3-phosphatase n=1 Tax=Aaosphaeria arxii CBS 175.79 TaxID=1450172 RepID=A0A6A5XXB8_9PLEO|nr:uncharacterized protein BU24DRAFT_162685 [Aaosphaeria arxii CBS 175.79]KAF2017975.1 hypothetical protein BU24DRAFT_162685 [Aaosphaeria arxii CBS 175.79]